MKMRTERTQVEPGNRWGKTTGIDRMIHAPWLEETGDESDAQKLWITVGE